METIACILFGFKEHLKVLNRSPATIEAYSENARAFLETIGEDARAVTQTRLESWIAGLYDHKTGSGKPYSKATISLKVRSVKRLFEYLEKANHIFINPAEFIREPKKVRGLPRNILTPSEARLILDQPNLGTLAGIRDRAILEVFYSTGIRLEELCALSIYDADLQGGMIRVIKGKGKKDRVVPMGRHAVRFLREYITRARPVFTRKNRAERRLFIDRRGKPVSKQTVAICVKTCARSAGIKKKVTAHTFRHTFAAGLVKNGAEITAVSKMLGHADLKTTGIYLRAAGIDLKKAHNLTHPREKDKEETARLKPRLERIRPVYGRKAKQLEP